MTLFPRGVTCVEDLPADLAAAIEQGHRILGWQENLSSDEMPPAWMWHLEWELEPWFEEVEIARKQKYGGDVDDREEVEMMTNDDAEQRDRFGR